MGDVFGVRMFVRVFQQGKRVETPPPLPTKSFSEGSACACLRKRTPIHTLLASRNHREGGDRTQEHRPEHDSDRHTTRKQRSTSLEYDASHVPYTHRTNRSSWSRGPIVLCPELKPTSTFSKVGNDPCRSVACNTGGIHLFLCRRPYRSPFRLPFRHVHPCPCLCPFQAHLYAWQQPV